MPRETGRKTKIAKPLICVFYEGESEKCYAEFLKKAFEDAASIKIYASNGLFDEANAAFHKETRYKSMVDVLNEIWFFFDVEVADHAHWPTRQKIICALRRMRKKPNIRVRLLMTTGCIEYWFMLHYQMMAPPIVTLADKERVLHQLIQKVPGYKKGDQSSIFKIAKEYPTGIINGQKTLRNLQSEGLPTLEDTDERNQWLHQSGKTFTTVQEAIEFLQSL